MPPAPQLRSVGRLGDFLSFLLKQANSRTSNLYKVEALGLQDPDKLRAHHSYTPIYPKHTVNQPLRPAALNPKP